MNYALPKLQFVEKSQTPKGFSVLAPVSGDVLPLGESNNPLLSNSVLGEGVAVKLTGNKLVAPFEGIIVDMPPTFQRFTIKAKSGLKVTVLLPENTDAYNGAGFLKQVILGQAVRMGQVIANFNPQQLQKLDDRLCAVVISNPEIIGRLYCSSKKVTAGEDVLLTVTARKNK